ncbi:MAG TPA: hypothetical protein VFY91_04760 [Microbacterium sp.]|nr:hypothetical protein [Microbacterium sp.]
MSTGEKTPAKTGRFARLRAAGDRVPTKWFAGILTGLFLAATAAFGGLADAPAPAVASLDLGEPHTSAQLTVQVEDVVLVDDFPELSLDLQPGERALIVLAHVTNEWTRPLYAGAGGSSDLADTVRVGVEALEGVGPVAIARVDDAVTSPLLQPGLRVPLAFIWAVPRSAVEGGDAVDVRVFDQSLYTGEVVTAGQWWDDPALAVTVSATITDLGSGATGDAEGDE